MFEPIWDRGIFDATKLAVVFSHGGDKCRVQTLMPQCRDIRHVEGSGGEGLGDVDVRFADVTRPWTCKKDELQFMRD